MRALALRLHQASNYRSCARPPPGPGEGAAPRGWPAGKQTQLGETGSTMFGQQPLIITAAVTVTAAATAYLLCYVICLFQYSDFGSGSEPLGVHDLRMVQHCPLVPKASLHHSLVVSNTDFTLPGGAVLHGMSYNWSYVGPPIYAQLGEEISIDVYNNADAGTSVHWHGMSMQGTAWADGTDGISQRAILPGHMFRYKFVAGPAGTAYYHSHSGLQFGDGLRGTLIVQDPNDPYADEYDEEMVVMLTDQSPMTGAEMLAGLRKNGMDEDDDGDDAVGMGGDMDMPAQNGMAMDMDEDDNGDNALGTNGMAMDMDEDDNSGDDMVMVGDMDMDSNDDATSDDAGNSDPGMGDMDNANLGVGHDDHSHEGACTGVIPEDYSDAVYYTILTNGQGWVQEPNSSKAVGAAAVFKVEPGKRYSKAVGAAAVFKVELGKRYSKAVFAAAVFKVELEKRYSKAFGAAAMFTEELGKDAGVKEWVPTIGLAWAGASGWVDDLAMGFGLGWGCMFRIVGGMSNWAVKMNISQHSMDVIALDGANVARTTTQAFVLTPGERVDIIVKADQPVGNYFINLVTMTGKNSPAILSYVGAPPPEEDPLMSNPSLKLGCEWMMPSKVMAMYLVDGSMPASASPEALLGPNASIPGLNPSLQPTTGCALPDGSPSKYCWTINWVPFTGSSNGTPLLLPGSQSSPQTYTEELALNQVVDVVFINPSGMVHPMHLHGHRFWVLGSGNSRILRLDGSIDYELLNTRNPILKDTTAVPQAVQGSKGQGLQWGYTVVRFKTDNPGIWPLHCHTDLHMATGMLMTFKVKAAAGAFATPDMWRLPRGAETCGVDRRVEKSKTGSRSTHMGLPVKLRLL
eukprot:gene11708-34436_t